MNAYDDALTAHTLYFGGGTPSLLSIQQVKRIIDTAREVFDLSLNAEITLETNPATTTVDRFTGYREVGVNRLSIGVQSAHASELGLFNRDHTFEEAQITFDLARQTGFDNVNVDLIYGVPGQTRESWRQSLQAVLAWKPDHISLYALSLEPGTALAWQVEQGHHPQPDPDLAADMYEDARTILSGAGFSHYEISNWGLPGFESRHNRQYWLNYPFLGFGPGAHGMANSIRYWNVRPVSNYIDRLKSAKPSRYPLSPACDSSEPISEDQARVDTMILGLRLLDSGLERERFRQLHHVEIDEVFGPLITNLAQQGLLLEDNRRIRLPEHTYLVSNQIFSRFML
jgi:oxygen-independent coproporphyrinogen-3 oxidase